MTHCATRFMVAVPGTQNGATTHTFDEERFLREVHWPVKEFIAATQGVCPVLIFFLVGHGTQYEEKITIPLPEQNEGEGCPGYLAAEKHLYQEVKQGLVSLACVSGEEAEHFEQTIGRFMTSRGVEDRRILSPRQLPTLAAELAHTVE